MDAMGLDVAAHGAELRLDVGRAGTLGKATLGLALGRRRFIAAGDKPGLRLRERRYASDLTARLALRMGVLLASGGGGVLQVAPRGARLRLGFRGRAHLGFGGL